jgi:bifunctional DNase/RNase
VQWCDIEVLADAFDNRVGDENGARECFCAMHNTMPDCMDIRLVADNAVILAQKDGEYIFDCADVIDYFARDLDFIPIIADVAERSTVHANALNATACHRFLGIDFNELIFDGRTAAIQNEYVHKELFTFMSGTKDNEKNGFTARKALPSHPLAIGIILEETFSRLFA